jgi:3-oxoacyl-[acyl-carrier protein] reductase
MIKGKKRAKVVLMLSENTIGNPAKFTSKYTMSKYMLLGLLKSLTVEYEGKNVNINALSPTMMDTKFLSNIDRRMLEVSDVTEKMLCPEDVVPFIIKLVSSESDNMYGENIYISKEKICKIE